MSDCLLETRGISKAFASVPVLKNVSIEIIRGEILGIIGENGAGKSTFMKILGGFCPATSGGIIFEGKRVILREPMDAKRLGIRMIPQEFNLVKDLTVSDNVFLGSELRKRSGLLDQGRMILRTRELLRELEVDIDPDAMIEGLSAAQKQMVEICKAVALDAKLLIMDEPTSVLTQHEIAILFGLMRRLQKQGVTIIYISHKLKEVKSICDRVMVLRDGEFVCMERTGDLSVPEMARRMVGRELNQIFPEKKEPANEIVMSVRNLSVTGVLANVSFDLKKGEILGLAGLVGSGRTEIAETILGIRRRSSGDIFMNGKRVTIHGPEDAVKCGIGYLSEDRQGSGILTGFSVVQNTTLVSLNSYCRCFFRFIRNRDEREATQGHKERFNIKTPSLDTRLEFLSGGNQQKVSLAKSMDPRPGVLIADEPTRGVDISAKQEMYRFIQSLVSRGLSCIFISSEQEEIIGMCHRVIVMKNGRIQGVLEGAQITEEEIIFHATGVREGAVRI